MIDEAWSCERDSRLHGAILACARTVDRGAARVPTFQLPCLYYCDLLCLFPSIVKVQVRRSGYESADAVLKVFDVLRVPLNAKRGNRLPVLVNEILRRLL